MEFSQNQNKPEVIIAPVEKIDAKLKTFAPVALRLFLSGVFLWFGFTQLFNSSGWVSYLPEFLQHTPIEPTLFIFLNASMEVILGIFLILGAYTRLSGLLLGLHLLGIAGTIGINAIGVRDIGLGLATLVIAFNGGDFFSLDVLIKNNKLKDKGYLYNILIRIFLGAVATGLLGLAFYIYINHSPNKNALRPLGLNARGEQIQTLPQNEKVLSAETVALHKNTTDCWLTIENKVYNVTPYIQFHPGGKDRIISNCGTDATTAFNTKGGTGDKHSANAHNILAGYFLGNLGTTVNTPAQISTSNPANITQSPQTTTPKTAPTPVTTNKSPTNVTSGTTAAQVATHKTSTDCWLIIEGKIYNVTAYIPFHPGGENRIISNCGKDATTAFNTKGGTGGAHSTNAHVILAGYFVGNASKATAQNSQTTPTPTPTPNLKLTPPTINISTPSANSTISGVVAFQATAVSQTGVLNVQFSLDSQFLGTSNINPYSVSLATTNYTNGSHTLKAIATDMQGQNASVSINITINNQAIPTPTPTPGQSSITASQVASHNNPGDCWLIIEGKVYNVTSYISVHPGGANRITSNCGTDATTAFNTKGGTGSTHSVNAHSILAGFYVGDVNQVSPTPTPTPGLTPTPTPTSTPTPTATPTPTPTQSGSGYTASQVATHNTSGNCWLIISNNVYNVTSYIPIHPGGQNRIISNCGTDATTAFNTKGGTGSSHSTNAHNILAGFLVGTLTTTPTPTPTPTTTPTPGSTPTPTPTPTQSGTNQTYTVNINSSGNISPTTLTINKGDTVKFVYTNPGSEKILVFSPTPPSSIKLDHEFTQKSYTFNTTGTYSYHPQDGGGTNATIIVQ